MASSYTPLGVELMVTGENAGTWGTKTNNNLSLCEPLIGGYKVQTLNTAGTGANTTTLTVTDGGTSGSAQNRVLILGAESAQAITGNKVVTIPLDVTGLFFVKNSTSGAYTVQFKYASGSGDTVTFATTDKGWKVLSATGNDASNPDIEEVEVGVDNPAGSDTQVQFNNSGSFGASANLTWDDANLTIAAEGDLRLGDNTGGEYVGVDAPATVSSSYTITLPAAVGSASQALVTSDGSGNTQWTSTSTFGISTGKAIAMAIVFG